MDPSVPDVPHPDDDRGDPDPPADGPATILVAEDDDEFRAAVTFDLALAGYPVAEATTLAALVAQASQVRPDVVLLADELDGLDVEKLLAAIADHPDLAGVPVITLSSDPGTERVVACLGLGARDHVRRQEGVVELMARLERVLQTDDELERLRRRIAELQFLGAVDPLTGMATRRQLEDELDRLAAGAARHTLPFSVVMARIDDLPLPRGSADLARHQESVLREVAFLVASVRRTDDYVGVWDSRTFVVLLPMTSLEGARAFAQRLREVVGAAPVRSRDRRLTVTLSASCAVVGDPPAAMLPQLELGVLAVQSTGGDGIAG